LLIFSDGFPKEKTLEMADKVYETTSGRGKSSTTPSVTPKRNTVGETSELDSCSEAEKMLKQFKKAFSDFTTMLQTSAAQFGSRPGTPTVSPSPSHSTSPTKNLKKRLKPFVKNDICTYHFRFKNEACKCMKGCKYFGQADDTSVVPEN